MQLYPEVKHLEKREGFFNRYSLPIRIVKTKTASPITYDGRGFFTYVDEYDEHDVEMAIDKTLGEEAYTIEVTEDGITIKHSTIKGAFYALITLFQIALQYQLQPIPCLYIQDEPELKVRGYMLDIARNKVPKLTTLMEIVDVLAELKYNHFELYVEGLAFYYPSFKDLYQSDMTPLKPNEFKKLETYARERMIDLVPCHNGLGHMTEWLTHYPELAIMPDGMFMWGAHRPASTINPLDPKSLELVQTFYKDALKSSKSAYFHMNLDEPYELGHGKTEEAGKTIGVGQMYLDYVLQLADFMKKNKRIPLIWGDVLNHYPETLEKLPKDIIFVDWGYDKDYPFEKTLKRLSDLGVHFMAAPGTSAWNSITGRTSTMIDNIRQACEHTKRNHGLGMLLTDWGDFGHLQTNVISLPAIVYGGLESWRGRSSNPNLIRHYIDRFVFNNKDLSIYGQFLLDMGRYVDLEDHYMSNGTRIMQLLWKAKSININNISKEMKETFKDHPYGKNDFYWFIKHQMELWRHRLRYGTPRDNNTTLYKKEISLSIDMLDMFISIIRLQNKDCKGEEYVHLVNDVKRNYPKMMQSFISNWKQRNKKGHLIDSLEPLQVYQLYVEQLIPELYQRNLRPLRH